MKAEMKHQLTKDIVVAVVAVVVMSILFGTAAGNGVFGSLVLGFCCAGIPFGWRWISNIITAMSLTGLALKFVFSIMLGWIALPVVIIKDIVNYVNAE